MHICSLIPHKTKRKEITLIKAIKIAKRSLSIQKNSNFKTALKNHRITVSQTVLKEKQQFSESRSNCEEKQQEMKEEKILE